MKVGDKVTCSARWVYGWHGVVIEVDGDFYKVKWNYRTAGECWVEASYLHPLTGANE